MAERKLGSNANLQTRDARNDFLNRLVDMRDAYDPTQEAREADYWSADRRTFEDELNAFAARTWDAWPELLS